MVFILYESLRSEISCVRSSKKSCQKYFPWHCDHFSSCLVNFFDGRSQIYARKRKKTNIVATTIGNTWEFVHICAIMSKYLTGNFFHIFFELSYLPPQMWASRREWREFFEVAPVYMEVRIRRSKPMRLLFALIAVHAALAFKRSMMVI